MRERREDRVVWFVVPCGAAKVDYAVDAAALYTGSAFKHVLHAARLEAMATARDLGIEARVLILSALHGLVEPERVLAPYDQKMGKPGAIDAARLAETAEAVGIREDDEVYALLPKGKDSPYYPVLAEALPNQVQDVYEAAPGIGYQRGVASVLARQAESNALLTWALA